MASDLEKYVAEREAREPGFAALVEAAEQRRAFAREMADRRKKKASARRRLPRR